MSRNPAWIFRYSHNSRFTALTCTRLFVQPVWVRSLAVIFFQLVARHRQAAVMRRAGVFIRSEWLDAGFGFQPGTDLPKAGKIAVLRRAPVSAQELLFSFVFTWRFPFWFPIEGHQKGVRKRHSHGAPRTTFWIRTTPARSSRKLLRVELLTSRVTSRSSLRGSVLGGLTTTRRQPQSFGGTPPKRVTPTCPRDSFV